MIIEALKFLLGVILYFLASACFAGAIVCGFKLIYNIRENREKKEREKREQEERDRYKEYEGPYRYADTDSFKEE